VRTAQPRDLPVVSRLYFQLNPARRRRGKITGLEGSLRTRVFVAEEGRRVLGFAWANLVQYANTHVGYIEELYVQVLIEGGGLVRLWLRAPCVGSPKPKLKWCSSRRAQATALLNSSITPWASVEPADHGSGGLLLPRSGRHGAAIERWDHDRRFFRANESLAEVLSGARRNFSLFVGPQRVSPSTRQSA